MKQQITNFGRFFSAFNRLTVHGDPEEIRKQLVLQYTSGRTESLKEMRRNEYLSLCMAIEEMNGSRDELKRRRSIALKLMQELNVDTKDWAQINDFCRNPRIAGKSFGQLSIDELIELAVKLRSIKRKEWQRKNQEAEKKQPVPQPQITYLVTLPGYPGICQN